MILGIIVIALGGVLTYRSEKILNIFTEFTTSKNILLKLLGLIVSVIGMLKVMDLLPF